MHSNSGEESWWQFLKLCLQHKTAEQLDETLDLFLTLDEKESIATRYAIVHELLLAQKPQRNIASDLGVSIAKITRGSNALKRTSEKLKRFLSNRMN